MTVAGGGIPTASPGGQPFQFNGEPYGLDPSVVPGLPRPIGWRVHLPDGTGAWDKFGPADTDWVPVGSGGGGGGGTGTILQAARVVATSNLSLSGLATTADGVLLNVPGDRVLAAGQTDPRQIGLYSVAAGAWTRVADFSTAGQMKTGALVPIYQGTTYAGTIWEFTTTGTITVGVTALTFTQDPGAGALAGKTVAQSRLILAPVYFAQVPAGPSVQSLTISGLPNDVDYDLYCHVIGGHAGTGVWFLPNSQTLNIRSVGTDQSIGGSSGTAAWAAYTNNAFLSGITGELKINGTVQTKSGRGSRSYHIQTLFIPNATPNAPHDCTCQGDWTDDATVMTSFQIMTNEVDGLAAGTFIQLTERFS